LKDAGLDLDNEITEEERYYLSKDKVSKLIKKLGSFLNFDDLMEIKKEINKLSRSGRTLPVRIEHSTKRKDILKQKYLRKQSPLMNYVVEEPTIIVVLCLMQLTSAFIVEILNIAVISGQRSI
jgi:hypothetical protein